MKSSIQFSFINSNFQIFLLSILFLAYSACSTSKNTTPLQTPSNQSTNQPNQLNQPFTKTDVLSAQKVFGLNFTETEIDTAYPNLTRNLNSYNDLRKHPLDNAVVPAMYFDPLPNGFVVPTEQKAAKWDLPQNVALPTDKNDLAFYTVAQLADLIHTKKISSVELTRFFLDRIKKYNPQLNAVVTITEKLALQQAQKADQEIAAGQYKGPLHGIPYGVKDLLAVPGYKTTWGAGPYKDQVIDKTATVVKLLEEAGGVLVAKLVSGELAYGDIWYGGRTNNPWDLNQGARGSSAGPGSATAAGLVPYSIGTETWGSIISPSSRCGVTGLRPTFGRVSRDGAMTLSWSLDKIGPMCRSALDCALVLNVIKGPDGKDRSVLEATYNYNANLDIRSLRVGYLKEAFEQDTSIWGEHNKRALQTFRDLGLNLKAIKLPGDISWNGVISTIIRAESGAAFDELLNTNQDDHLARQGPVSRANSLRQSRFIPAAEYVQANRHRTILIEAMEKLFQQYDIIIAPTFGSQQSAISNLTGHPVIVFPNGFDKKERPTSISILGKLFDEATILAVAKQFQDRTDFEDQHPKGFRE